MSFAVIDTPNSVCDVRATSWILLFPESAMYSCWDEVAATDSGKNSSADVAFPPSPDLPYAPVTLPATV